MEKAAMQDNQTIPDRYVSVKELRQRLGGVSTSTIYRMMDAGELARPSRLTLRRVGWPVEYINSLLARRVTPEQAERPA
jgi:predicted DNA-binding transcriptional regulator AlpA